MTFSKPLYKAKSVVYDRFRLEVTLKMGFAKSEAEIGERAARFIKAELKRANLTYDELAVRLMEHGLSETRNSITAKLKRGTFSATFLIAVIAALELTGVQLEDL
jgi:hypothetical protein